MAIESPALESYNALSQELDEAREAAEELPPARRRLRTMLPPCLALIALALGLCWELCLGGSLYWGDIHLYFTPMYALCQKALQSGRLPLWNPGILTGQPLLGNPQMGVFYPTTWALLWVPVWLYLTLTTVLHLALAGLGMYLYLRRWTKREAAALAGAMVYEGSACLVGRAQFPPMIYTAAYLPFLLWQLDLYIEGGKPVLLPCIAVTVGLIFLAAHPQMAYLLLLCGSIYAVFRLLARHSRDWSAIRRNVAWLAGALALGGAVCAAQVLPGMQLVLESPREKMTPDEANRFVLLPQHLLTLVAPRFFGHPASGDYWGRGNAWEPAFFVGWLPLICIGAALVFAWKRRKVRFWAYFGATGIWLAFGKNGLLFWLAFYAVPGVSLFHDPARFLFFVTISFAVLTAFGWESLAERMARKGRRSESLWTAFGLGAVFAPLVWYGWDWNPTAQVADLAHRPRILDALQEAGRAPKPGAERLYLPEYLVLWSRYVNYSDYGGAGARSLAGLIDTFMPNLSLFTEAEVAQGYEPVPLDAPLRADGAARRALAQQEPNVSRLIGTLNVATLLLPNSMNVTDARLTPLELPGRESGLHAWTNRDALPRAWLVRKARTVAGRGRAVAALTAPEFKPDREAIVSGGPDSFLPAMEWSPSAEPTQPVTITHYAGTEIRMTADAGKSAALLVYSGAAFPGWQATVDGERVPLYRANASLLGVYLAPGAHEVRLIYAPETVRLGLYGTLFACAVVSGGFGFCAAQRSRTLRRGGRS